MTESDTFDPTRVLDGWRVPPPAPLQALELETLLQMPRTGLDEAKIARLKARGYDMQDVEDVNLPEIPRPATPVAPPPLDLPATRAQPDPRLISQWQPQAWTALARRIRGSTAEVVQTAKGPLVENYAPQWLCAVWPPQRLDRPLLGRWPEMAALVDAETVFGALHQLLPELPPEATLWPADLDIDWALVADLVLHQDAGLRPDQAQALRALTASERGASFSRINDQYRSQRRVARRRG